jgi:Mn-dependent DtxR family transcriptional regulator
MLVGFLRTIGVHEKKTDLEVEGIEHYISKQTALSISSLVSFFEENPHIMESFIQYQKQWKDKGLEHD